MKIPETTGRNFLFLEYSIKAGYGQICQGSEVTKKLAAL